MKNIRSIYMNIHKRLNLFLEYKFLYVYGTENYSEKILWRQHETPIVMVSTFCCHSFFFFRQIELKFTQNEFVWHMAIAANERKILLRLYFLTF